MYSHGIALWYIYIKNYFPPRAFTVAWIVLNESSDFASGRLRNLPQRASTRVEALDPHDESSSKSFLARTNIRTLSSSSSSLPASKWLCTPTWVFEISCNGANKSKSWGNSNFSLTRRTCVWCSSLRHNRVCIRALIFFRVIFLAGWVSDAHYILVTQLKHGSVKWLKFSNTTRSNPTLEHYYIHNTAPYFSEPDVQGQSWRVLSDSHSREQSHQDVRILPNSKLHFHVLMIRMCMRDFGNNQT